MLLPAATGFGVPLLVTAKSQASATGVVTVVLLFAELGSLVLEETDEFAVIVVAPRVDARLTTTRMFADAPEAKVGSVQVMLPLVAPTAGVAQVQPAGIEMEANDVLVGMASVKLAEEADAGPLFVIV
jgi:hypothetical protein